MNKILESLDRFGSFFFSGGRGKGSEGKRREVEDLPDDPEIITPMPTSPEAECGVVVCHTTDHILWWVNAVQKGPESEEPPG